MRKRIRQQRKTLEWPYLSNYICLWIFADETLPLQVVPSSILVLGGLFLLLYLIRGLKYINRGRSGRLWALGQFDISSSLHFSGQNIIMHAANGPTLVVTERERKTSRVCFRDLVLDLYFFLFSSKTAKCILDAGELQKFPNESATAAHNGLRARTAGREGPTLKFCLLDFCALMPWKTGPISGIFGRRP